MDRGTMLYICLCLAGLSYIVDAACNLTQELDSDNSSATTYSFSLVRPSAILTTELHGLSNITWSEVSSPIQCARLTYRQCCRPKGFLYDPESRLCQPIFWSVESGSHNFSVGNNSLYGFDSKSVCKSGFQALWYGTQPTLACLLIPIAPKKYDAATERCRDYEGYLASAKTAEKLTLLLDLAQGRNFWVGLDDLQNETIFVWQEDGSQLTEQQTAEVFVPGQPEPADRSNCARVVTPEVKLTNRKCAKFIHSFCETKPGC